MRSAECTRCHEEDDSVEHYLLKCSALNRARERSSVIELEDLWRRLAAVRAYNVENIDL